MKLPVSEIYPAIQGEGQYRTKALFIRVWGCNLRCQFNGKCCDTPYAVIEGDKKQMDPMEVVEEIHKNGIKHIVFTGGEPLLYQKHLWEIIGQLTGEHFIEVETNGTIPVVREMKEYVDQFNISVKLKSSKQMKGYSRQRINLDALNEFPLGKSTFKFVVSSEDDIREIKKIEEIRPDIPITLMPEGETQEQVLKNLPETLELCMKHNYGFTNRDHILAFGKKRGV